MSPSPSSSSSDDPSKRSYQQRSYAIDLSFISDAEITELNRDYRHKNKPTDVLSFSLWEGEDAPPPLDEMPLGDLVISIETAARQARELRHSLTREVEFLAVHGALHLLGYDHIRAADRRVMWKWQEEIVERIGGEAGIQNSESGS